MTCDCHAEVLAQLAESLAQLAEMRAMLERLAPPPEPEPEAEPVPPLVQALAVTFGHRCFTAAEAWQRATGEAVRAAAHGELEPELPAVLRDLGIEGARSLGHHLSKHEGAGIGRGGLQHNANTWEVRPWARRS